MLQPESSGFYKAIAVECAKSQVTVEFFAFGSQYMDLATLSTSSAVCVQRFAYHPM